MADTSKIAVACIMQQNIERIINDFKNSNNELSRDEVAKLLDKFAKEIYNAMIK